MSASLKAGLVGAAAAVVLALLGQIPCAGCLACLFVLAGLALYVAVGALAAFWIDPPRTAGAGARRLDGQAGQAQKPRPGLEGLRRPAAALPSQRRARGAKRFFERQPLGRDCL